MRPIAQAPSWHKPRRRRCALLGLLAVAALLGAALPGRAAAQTSPRQALVLEPFAAELGNADTVGKTVVDTLQNAGYTVTELRDNQVTIPVMLNLSQYSFVYFDTHIGPLPNNDAAVATGDTRHHKFASYFANYSLAQMRILKGASYKYFDAITGRFIHRYVGTFQPHTIFFLSACTALDMPLFWRYLHEAGVSTLISWYHHVTSSDADQAALDMFAALAKGQTVDQAVAATRDAGAGISIVKGSPGWLGFRGSGSSTLLSVSPYQVEDSLPPSKVAEEGS